MNATNEIAFGLLSYYTGNISGGANVGLLPAPYYWWEAGAVWNGLINYWHYTNDSTYNDITAQAILANVGPAYDFIVPTQVGAVMTSQCMYMLTFYSVSMKAMTIRLFGA